MKTIVRVTSNKKYAQEEAKRINASFAKRKIKRVAYVTKVSKQYVKKLTRKGYPIAEKNYGIQVKNKRARKVFRPKRASMLDYL